MIKFLSYVFLIFTLVEYREVEAGGGVSNFFKNIFNFGKAPTVAPGGGAPCVTATNPTYDAILASGSLQFALNVYQLLQNQSNVFFSPFSLRVALAMAAAGAQGPTLSQMNTGLQLSGFQSQNQSNQAFLDMLGSLCANPNYTLSAADRLYLQQSFPVLPAFLSTLQTYFQAQAVNVNFQSDASAAIAQINQFVSSATQGTIPQLFAQGSLDASTILVIVNAVYFKGSWASQFPLSATVSQPFSPSVGATVQVPMMRLTASLPYLNSTALNAQVLQMNYTGGRLCMYILLPWASSSLAALQSKLNVNTFNGFRSGLRSQQVQVGMPKFTLSFRQQMNGVLQSLGMTDMFSPTAANLSGMATPASGKNLYVSTVVHQAYVAVDEQGTTASAATGIGISVTSIQIPNIFLANRPFIYVIYDQLFNQPLFMGNLNNPNA